MTRCRAGRSRGFTLVELIVVLGLFGVVSALGFGLIRSARGLWEKETERSMQLVEVRRTLSGIAQALSCTLAPDGSDRVVFEGKDDQIRYTELVYENPPEPTKVPRVVAGDSVRFTTARLSLAKGEPVIGIVEYKVVTRKDGTPDGVVRLESLFRGAEIQNYPYKVSHSVRTLDLKYGVFDKGNLRWFSHWPHKQAGDRRLPSLVRITVSVPKSEEPKIRALELSTTVSLEAANSSGK